MQYQSFCYYHFSVIKDAGMYVFYTVKCVTFASKWTKKCVDLSRAGKGGRIFEPCHCEILNMPLFGAVQRDYGSLHLRQTLCGFVLLL